MGFLSVGTPAFFFSPLVRWRGGRGGAVEAVGPAAARMGFFYGL